MRFCGPLIVVLAALALAPSALASAQSVASANAATTACKSERAQVGEATFLENYGSLGACKQSYRALAVGAANNAAKACKVERKKRPAMFRSKYGVGKKKRNAYGRCVSKKARGALEDTVATNVDAMTACTEYRDEDPAGFAGWYGEEADALATCVAEELAPDEDTGDDETVDDGADDGVVDEDDGGV
jgi:hypothetical protein